MNPGMFMSTKCLGVLVAVLLVLVGQSAMAKRLGGGKSLGKQSANVSQSVGSPQAPATAVAAPAPAAPVTATPAGATRTAYDARAVPGGRSSPWGGVLGSVAAGLGLVWLAHSFGLGETAPVWMVMGFVVLFLLSWGRLVRRVRRQTFAGGTVGTFAFQGVAPMPLATARPYRPENVGNDASARPFERSLLPSAANGSVDDTGSVTAPWGVPAAFDTTGFLAAAKANFLSLQQAWDRGDIPSLSAMMTDTMVAEVRAQLAEREAYAPSEPNVTEVVMLNARLLGIEERADAYLASVEFSGMIREDQSVGPSPFREVWNMSKPRSGERGWLVAGVQALQ